MIPLEVQASLISEAAHHAKSGSWFGKLANHATVPSDKVFLTDRSTNHWNNYNRVFNYLLANTSFTNHELMTEIDKAL